VSDLDDVLVEDLKRQLKEMGYSDRAVEEILRWYRQKNDD
jgi:predicted Ser/Thr protein kinase